jgi:uroporphyrinogen-III decarboxylase
MGKVIVASQPVRAFKAYRLWPAIYACRRRAAFARGRIQVRKLVQGNLDPLALIAGGIALDEEIESILKAFSDRPFIFISATVSRRIRRSSMWSK